MAKLRSASIALTLVNSFMLTNRDTLLACHVRRVVFKTKLHDIPNNRKLHNIRDVRNTTVVMIMRNTAVVLINRNTTVTLIMRNTAVVLY